MILRSGSKLFQVMACCLTALSHNLTNANLWSKVFCGTYLRPTSREVLETSISEMCLTIVKLLLHFSRPNSFRYCYIPTWYRMIVGLNATYILSLLVFVNRYPGDKISDTRTIHWNCCLLIFFSRLHHVMIKRLCHVNSWYQTNTTKRRWCLYCNRGPSIKPEYEENLKTKISAKYPWKLTYNGLSITYKVICSHAVKARRLETWKSSAFVHDLIKPAISWDHESNIKYINGRDSNKINNSSPFN